MPNYDDFLGDDGDPRRPGKYDSFLSPPEPTRGKYDDLLPQSSGMFDDLIPRAKKAGVLPTGRQVADLGRGNLATIAGFIPRALSEVEHLGSKAAHGVGLHGVGDVLDKLVKSNTAFADDARDKIVGNDPNKDETASQIGQVGSAVPLQIAKYAAMGPAAIPVMAAEAAASDPEQSSAAMLSKGAKAVGNPFGLGDILDKAAQHPVSRSLADLLFNVGTEGALRGVGKAAGGKAAPLRALDADGNTAFESNPSRLIAPKSAPVGRPVAGEDVVGPGIPTPGIRRAERDPSRLLMEKSPPVGRAVEGDSPLGPAIPMPGVPVIHTDESLFGDLIPPSRQLERGPLVTPAPVPKADAKIRKLVVDKMSAQPDVPRASVDGAAGPAVPPVEAVPVEAVPPVETPAVEHAKPAADLVQEEPGAGDADIHEPHFPSIPTITSKTVRNREVFNGAPEFSRTSTDDLEQRYALMAARTDKFNQQFQKGFSPWARTQSDGTTIAGTAISGSAGRAINGVNQQTGVLNRIIPELKGRYNAMTADELMSRSERIIDPPSMAEHFDPDAPDGVASAFTAFDVGGATKAALGTRVGRGTLISGTGAAMQSSDDERIKATGRGMIGLGMLHAFAPQVRALAGKVGGTITDAMSKTKLGTTILNTISHDILADPAIKQVVSEAQDGIALGRARGRELSAKARALGPVGDRAVSDVVEGEHFEKGVDPKDVPAVVAVAEQVSKEFSELGHQKVEAGLLTPETLAKRDGTYLPRMYAEHEVAGSGPTGQGGSKFRIKGDKVRDETLTPEDRNNLGEIREASYRTGQGIERGYRDVATAKMFNALNEMPGVIHPGYAQAAKDLQIAKRASVTAKTPAQQAVADQQFWAARGKMQQVAKDAKDAGYITMPDTRAMGALAGAVVRRDVGEYLNAVPDLSSPKGLWGKILKPWKVSKTAYNPGTNSRNFLGNIMLAHMGGMPMQTFPKWWAKGLEDYRAYGTDARYLAEHGIIGSADPVSGDAANGGTLTGDAALRNLARTTRPETKAALGMAGVEPMGNVERALRSGNAKVQAFYGAGDGVFRVGFFKKLVAEGVPRAEAAARTHEQFVHYDTRSPLLGALRNSVSPFIMFPAKAIPMVLNQIVDHPVRWLTLAAMWGGLDQISRREYGAMDEHDLPENQRNNSMLGYLLPGKIQVDAIAQPIAKAVGHPIKPGTHPTIDVGGLTPLAGLTGTTTPGAIGTKFELPSVLQPSGPIVDFGARAFNTDPYTGRKWMTAADETSDKVAKVAGALGGFVLPSAASFHAPRIAGDLRDGDGAAAALDALGFAGMRPSMVRHGVQQQADRRAYESAVIEVKQDLKRAVINAANSPARQESLKEAARAKLRRLADNYRASVATAPDPTSERQAYTPPQ